MKGVFSLLRHMKLYVCTSIAVAYCLCCGLHAYAANPISKEFIGYVEDFREAGMTFVHLVDKNGKEIMNFGSAYEVDEHKNENVRKCITDANGEQYQVKITGNIKTFKDGSQSFILDNDLACERYSAPQLAYGNYFIDNESGDYVGRMILSPAKSSGTVRIEIETAFVEPYVECKFRSVCQVKENMLICPAKVGAKNDLVKVKIHAKSLEIEEMPENLCKEEGSIRGEYFKE